MSRFREWMNEGAGKWITIVACLGLTTGATAWWILRPSTDAAAVGRIKAKGSEFSFYCRACKKTGKTRIAWGQAPPVACPECQVVQAYPGFSCAGCRKIIERREETFYSCPHCRYTYDRRTTMDGAGGEPGGP